MGRNSCGLFLLCLLLGSGGIAEAETLRLRVSWGGGEERQWHGTIAVRNGTVSEPQPLGMEADEAGSMWVEQGQLIVAQRSPRGYDGVELLVEAALQSSLVVSLSSSPNDTQGPAREISLAELTQNEFNPNLDDHGNRLSVRRAPGDQLRVRLNERSLVFAPGERLTGQIEPHLLPMKPGTEARLSYRLLPARTPSDSWSTERPLARPPADLWTHEQSFVVGETEQLPLEVPLPDQEGAYDLVLTATQVGILAAQQPRTAQILKQPWVERRLQVIVVRPERPASRAEGELRPVVEIDPANPKWWGSSLPACRSCRSCSDSGRGRWATAGSIRSSIPWGSWPAWRRAARTVR